MITEGPPQYYHDLDEEHKLTPSASTSTRISVIQEEPPAAAAAATSSSYSRASSIPSKQLDESSSEVKDAAVTYSHSADRVKFESSISRSLSRPRRHSSEINDPDLLIPAAKRDRSTSKSESGSPDSTATRLGMLVFPPFKAEIVCHETREVEEGHEVVFYCIECSNGTGASWTIWKRFSDFAKLHRSLKKDKHILKSKTEIPKFKKTFEDDIKTVVSKKYRFDEAFLLRRSEELARYLQCVTSDPAIVSSVLVKRFIDPKQKIKQLPLLSVVEEASPGDLILFRTPGLVTETYRGIMQGHWDHIGIVVPYPANCSKEKKLLGLLEATKDGVEVYSLKARLRNWNRFFPGIQFGYRKMVFERSDDFNERIKEFVSTVRGKSYGFPVTTFRMKSMAGIETAIEKNQFFCSELVAKCYKHAGLIEDERASCTYLPHTFASATEDMGFKDNIEAEEIVFVDMSEFAGDLLGNRGGIHSSNNKAAAKAKS